MRPAPTGAQWTALARSHLAHHPRAALRRGCPHAPAALSGALPWPEATPVPSCNNGSSQHGAQPRPNLTKGVRI